MFMSPLDQVRLYVDPYAPAWSPRQLARLGKLLGAALGCTAGLDASGGSSRWARPGCHFAAVKNICCIYMSVHINPVVPCTHGHVNRGVSLYI